MYTRVSCVYYTTKQLYSLNLSTTILYNLKQLKEYHYRKLQLTTIVHKSFVVILRTLVFRPYPEVSLPSHTKIYPSFLESNPDVSPCKISGNIVDSSSMASSIELASPTYDCEPASGKDAVSTGAFDIRKSKSMVCVPFSGSW